MAVNISNTEWIAPVLSPELDDHLQWRESESEFWDAAKAIAVRKDIITGKGGEDKYVPDKQVSGKLGARWCC